jgi:DNA-binding SARP family transcriptional activator
VEFRILGPLEVIVDGQPLALGGSKPRALLAILLLHANRVVPSDQLIEELWDGHPPERALGTLQTYVSHLRDVLEPGRPRGAAPEVLVTRAPGYLLQITPDQLDAARFERLLKEGTAALQAGEPDLAAARLRAGLQLWRGSVLAEFGGAAFARAEIIRLEELYLAAVETRVEADLALGRHVELVGELEALTGKYPLQERLCAQLMLALYRCGRQADALRAYRDTRKLFADEFGIEPNASLRRLEQDILLQAPELDWTPREPVSHGPHAKPILADLSQLPPDLVDFTGRALESGQIRDLLAYGVAPQATAVTTLVIAGKGGVGKTALAVHVAHQVRQHFPDGQLYMTLQGGAQPLEPAAVLAEFLRNLGVPPTAIPDGLKDRARLYRSRLAGKRILVVLNDAADEAQVRPLLPGDAGCAVLVTSRRRLAGLAGAITVELDVMEPGEAIELLGKVAGSERVAAEPDAAAELVHLCGYLPLAVRIAGARLAARPHLQLATYAVRLRDERRRLEELRVGDLGVRASFALSYLTLNGDEQRAFRLLGMLDGPDFAAWVAAALLDCALYEAEDLVERLVDAQLLEAGGEDATGLTRYRFRDLLRVFARECLREEEPASVHQAALERALTTYLKLAEWAGYRLGREDQWVSRDAARQHDPADDSGLAALVERDPLAWFRIEQDSLIAAVGQAYNAGLWKLTWELTDSLYVFFNSCGQLNALEHAHALALDATRKAANRQAEAYTLRAIAHVYLWRGQVEASMGYVERCQELFAVLGDQLGTAYALLDIGITHRYRGRLDDALASLERCLPLFHKLGNQLGEAATLRNIGIIHRDRGHPDTAMACLTQALKVFQSCDAHLSVALTLRHLGVTHRRCSRYDDAIACTQESLVILRRLGNRPGEATALCNLAQVYRRLGRFDDALDCLNASLGICRELGDRRAEAFALRTLGGISGDQGRLDEARDYYDRCLPVFREFDDRLREAEILHELGKLAGALGHGDDAMDYFGQSLGICREFGLPLKEARTLASIGTLLASRGDRAAAETAWRQALTIFRRLDAPEADQVQMLLRP